MPDRPRVASPWGPPAKIRGFLGSPKPYKSLFWLSDSESAGSIHPRRVPTQRVFLKFCFFCMFFCICLSKTIVFLYKSTLGISESDSSMKLPHLWYWRNNFSWFFEGRTVGRIFGSRRVFPGAAAPGPPRRLGVSPVGLSPVGLSTCFYANIYVFAKIFFVR